MFQFLATLQLETTLTEYIHLSLYTLFILSGHFWHKSIYIVSILEFFLLWEADLKMICCKLVLNFGSLQITKFDFTIVESSKMKLYFQMSNVQNEVALQKDFFEIFILKSPKLFYSVRSYTSSYIHTIIPKNISHILFIFKCNGQL